MEDTKFIINSLSLSIRTTLVLMGLFAVESFVTLFVLPIAWIANGFDDTKAVESLGYSPGVWADSYWEKSKDKWFSLSRQ